MCAQFFLSGISMKRVSQLTALALLIGLAASTSFAAETMPTLTLSSCNSSTVSH
jgi:thiosulfate/3-mercaptopyruvate sulfurtransferase